MPVSDETLRAVLLFLGGGVMLEIVRQFGKRSESVVSDSITQRAEWRDMVATLHVDVRLLRKELDEKVEIVGKLQSENAECRATQMVQASRIKELQEQVGLLTKQVKEIQERRSYSGG